MTGNYEQPLCQEILQVTFNLPIRIFTPTRWPEVPVWRESSSHFVHDSAFFKCRSFVMSHVMRLFFFRKQEEHQEDKWKNKMRDDMKTTLNKKKIKKCLSYKLHVQYISHCSLSPYTSFWILWLLSSYPPPPTPPPPQFSLLYLISTAQVFYSTRANLIWLSSI